MLTRRDLLVVGGSLLAASCRRTVAARDARKPPAPKLATVTLAISGMT